MSLIEELIGDVKEFEWDAGNIQKNYTRHNVHFKECEECFFNKPLVLFPDHAHSTKNERRFGAYGLTDNKRYLSLYFTLRDGKIRIISARDQSRKERRHFKQIVKDYEKK